MIQKLLLSFIPIFVAVDAVGVLPIFTSLTHGLKKKEKSKIILESVITALCLAIFFIFLGKAVFSFLRITVGDFMIAGGLILLCIAIIDIVSPGKKRRIPSKELGSVPLGTPLIVGPAVLTTSIIIIGEYGLYPVLISIFVNVILAAVIFSFSDAFMKVLGESGSKALSKIMSLLLAAIAIMMMRRGVFQILTITPL